MELKKFLSMAALTATVALAPKAAKAAQPNHVEPLKTTGIEKVDTSVWQWQGGAASLQERAVYESLPKEYKAFANKNFEERMEIKEEWEQRDFLKRDKARSEKLKQNPDATTSMGLRMADYPTASFSYETHIEKDVNDGVLTRQQGQLAMQLATFGRPLSTIDPKLPYAEQLEICGFEQSAKIAGGMKERAMSPRDHSIYVAEQNGVRGLDVVGNNEDARRAIRIRCEKEDDEAYRAEHGGILGFLRREKTRLLSPEEVAESSQVKFEVINGKDVTVPNPRQINYSYYDELTRKIADKIEKDDAQKAANATKAAQQLYGLGQ